MIQGIQGPSMQEQGIEFDIPACVQIKDKKDQEEFTTLINSIIKKTREDCLNKIANYVASSNSAMAVLVKNLGGNP